MCCSTAAAVRRSVIGHGPITYAVRDEVDSEQVQAAAETVRQRAVDVLADAPLSWSWAAAVGRTGTCSSSKLTRSTRT